MDTWLVEYIGYALFVIRKIDGGSTTPMKKLIALFLALVLTLSVSAVSLADDPDEIPGTVEMPYAGLRFVPPELYRETTGRIVTDMDIELSDQINYAYWIYCAMTEDQLNEVYANPETATDSPMTILFYVFSIGAGNNFDDMNALIGNMLNPDCAREIGKVGEYTFYLYMEGPDSTFADSIDPIYKDEYVTLASAVDEAASAFTCYEPTARPDPYAAMVGSRLEFESVDLDGNPVSSVELFAQNEITMVNVWATWCGPCVGELAELQQLSALIQMKNCGIVGLMVDDDLDSARQLLDENGVTYPIVLSPKGLVIIDSLEYIPTTFFVDKEGTILASPIVGAQVAQYGPTLDSLLQQ